MRGATGGVNRAPSPDGDDFYMANPPICLGKESFVKTSILGHLLRPGSLGLTIIVAAGAAVLIGVLSL
jgi:hypothetical protein